jgi:hypothetical protein
VNPPWSSIFSLADKHGKTCIFLLRFVRALNPNVVSLNITRFGLAQHGGGSCGRSAGDGDAERRARGFQLGQHGGGSFGRSYGDGDGGERRPAGFQLGQHGAGTSSRSAGGQHGGGTSSRSAGAGNGERWPRGFQLGQPGGSTSASASAPAWTTNGGGNGASTDRGKRPSPPWDVSEIPVSASPLFCFQMRVFLDEGKPHRLPAVLRQRWCWSVLRGRIMGKGKAFCRPSEAPGRPARGQLRPQRRRGPRMASTCVGIG